MRYYIIAGEASGDLHGSNLIRGLAAEDGAAQLRFWGGDMMLAAARENGVQAATWSSARATSSYGSPTWWC